MKHTIRRQEDDVWKGHILSLVPYISMFWMFFAFCESYITNMPQCKKCKEVKVKPQPAKTVVKAFCVSALKKSI